MGMQKVSGRNAFLTFIELVGPVCYNEPIRDNLMWKRQLSSQIVVI